MPSLRVIAMRSSPRLRDRAADARADRRRLVHRAQQKPRTSGSSRIAIGRRAGERRDRVHRHVAPQLVPDVAPDVGAGSAVEAGAARAAAQTARDARRRAAARLADDQPVAEVVAHHAGLGRRAASRWTTQPSTCSSGMAAAMRAAGVDARERRRSASAPDAVGGTTTARRSSPAARACAGRAAAAASARPPPAPGPSRRSRRGPAGPSARGVVAGGDRRGHACRRCGPAGRRSRIAASVAPRASPKPRSPHARADRRSGRRRARVRQRQSSWRGWNLRCRSRCASCRGAVSKRHRLADGETALLGRV